MQFRSTKHATDGGTSRRFLDRFHTPRTSSKRRRAPMLEMLEGRTLLSISASSPLSGTSIGPLTFTGTASSSDQLTLSTTKDSGTGAVTGFDAIYRESGSETPTGHFYTTAAGVTSITVDYNTSSDTGSTLILGNSTGAWTFGVPITLQGDSTNSTTLETQATTGTHTWTLTGAYAGNIDLTGVIFTNVGHLTAGSARPIPWSVDTTTTRPGP